MASFRRVSKKEWLTSKSLQRGWMLERCRKYKREKGQKRRGEGSLMEPPKNPLLGLGGHAKIPQKQTIPTKIPPRDKDL